MNKSIKIIMFIILFTVMLICTAKKNHIGLLSHDKGSADPAMSVEGFTRDGTSPHASAV
jgi:hypothetical protein